MPASQTISFSKSKPESKLVEICQLSSQEKVEMEPNNVLILLTTKHQNETWQQVGKLTNDKDIIYTNRKHLRTDKNAINAFLTDDLDTRVIEWIKSTFNLDVINKTNDKQTNCNKQGASCSNNSNLNNYLPPMLIDMETFEYFDVEEERYYQDMEALRLQIEYETIELQGLSASVEYKKLEMQRLKMQIEDECLQVESLY